MTKKSNRPRKYDSKYRLKYGYTINECAMWLGWSQGTVQAYFKDPFKRKEMLDLVKIEERGK